MATSSILTDFTIKDRKTAEAVKKRGRAVRPAKGA